MSNMSRFILCFLLAFIILCNSGCQNVVISQNDIEVDTAIMYEPVLLGYCSIIKDIAEGTYSPYQANSQYSLIDTFGGNLGMSFNDLNTYYTTPSEHSSGYIYDDINEDKVPELFFVREDYSIIAMFTIIGEDVVMLGCYNSRNNCVLSDSNFLINRKSGGADCTTYDVYSLKKDATDLQIIVSFGMDKEYFFKKMDDNKRLIDSDEFENLSEMYSFAPNMRWLEKVQWIKPQK